MVGGGLSSGNNFLSTRKRRSLLRQFDHNLIEHTSARFVGTASIMMTPAQATRALRMLRFDRFGADLYVIPVAGGSVLAAFAGVGSGNVPWPLMGRLAAFREEFVLKRALRSLERRFRVDSPRSR
jgi:hypothetical protein